MQNEELTKWPFAQDLRGRALHFAKGYDRLRREADEMIQQAPVMDGQPRGTKTSDPTAAAAIRRERITREIRIIEGALNDIEPEYREAIVENVCRGVRMEDLEGFSVSSLIRRRRTFLAGIVKRAGWVEEWPEAWEEEWRSY